jgi:hypothetical protein
MSLLNPNFRYVPASKTNVAKTFKRIRREMKEAEAAKQTAPKVESIQRAKRKAA